MEELNKKLGELNQELGATKNIIKDIEKDIEEFKEKKQSYLGAEITLADFKEKKRKLEQKIAVLNEASNIILGI